MWLLYTIAPLLVAAKSRLATLMAERLDDNTLLRRAKAIDDWFAEPTNRTTPVAWTVRRKSDVQLGEMISSKAKKVYRGSMRGALVIVKGKGRHAAGNSSVLRRLGVARIHIGRLQGAAVRDGC